MRAAREFREWEENGVRIIGYSVLGSILLIGVGWLLHFLLTKEVSLSSPVRLWGDVVITFPFNLPKFVSVLGGFLVGPIAFLVYDSWRDDDKSIAYIIGLITGTVLGLGLALGLELSHSWITLSVFAMVVVVLAQILQMITKPFNLSEDTNWLFQLATVPLSIIITWLFVAKFLTFAPLWVTLPLGTFVGVVLGAVASVGDIDRLLLVVGLFFGIQLPAILGLGLLSGAISGLLILTPFVIGWFSRFVLLALKGDIKKLLSLLYRSLFKKPNLTYSR